MKVIDCRIQYHIHQPSYHQGYADMYRYANEEYWPDSPLLHGKDFTKTFNEIMTGPTELFVRFLDDVGVSVAVLTPPRPLMGLKGDTNEWMGKFARNHPDRVIAFARVEALKGMAAVRELEKAMKELGLRGLSLSTWELGERGLYPTDRRFYPLYAKCIDLDIPVMFHASINFSADRQLDFSQPRYIDEVACDLPELKIIANHGGWPWMPEMVAVAWRHRNVYIALSSIRPKHMLAPNSGWEMLIHYGNNVIQDKVLFGSGWPSLPLKRTIQEVMDFPLKQEAKEKWFHKNAERLFNIPE